MESEAAKDGGAAREPDYRISRHGNVLTLALTGTWITSDAVRLDRSLHALDMGAAAEIEIDGGKLERLDSAGAWLVLRTKRAAEQEGKRVQLRAMPESFTLLVDTLHNAPVDKPVRRAHQDGLTHLLGSIGRGVFEIFGQAYAMLGYLGVVAVEGGETLLRKRRFRIIPLIVQIRETGLTALPLLSILSFLLGIVIAYQGVDQLTRFGAQIFTVNLVGVSVLREIAALIAAIIVAGRSGSAFTAQIGTMKVNQEIDALETMGADPVEILVLPRILGLMIALPLLTVFADAMGLLGGAAMCYFDLGIGFGPFLHQLRGAISLDTFLVGIVKAPVFAFLIAFVGCFEGLRVESNAASLGRLTTRSVVESIFLVIVCDAGFSILFALLGV